MSGLGDIVHALDEPALEAWLRERRWFASKARDLQRVSVLDVLTLRADDPPLLIAIVEARFHAGTHELYQLVLTLAPGAAPPAAPDGDGDGEGDGEVAAVGDVTVVDALADAEAAAHLGELLLAGAEIEGPSSRVVFTSRGAGPGRELPRPVRALGAEQSNSSIVFDEELILKCFRRLEPGDNPELEMLRFLGDHGFGHIAPVEGWYEYRGELLDATLGVAQRFVAGRDGWELALELLARDPQGLVAHLRELGGIVGEMHTILASDASHADFAPEEKSGEAVALLIATIDEEVRRAFDDLPADDERFASIAGRGQEIRDRLTALAKVGDGGRAIRTHGDLHLGQTLRLADGRWILIDFEGEPARPLRERRRKRSPLRDVAAMLRSISYVAVAGAEHHGAAAPEGWTDVARAAFLEGYRATVDPALLPGGEQFTKLVSVYELEKAIYELNYERNNRPEWVSIPVAGIERLLEEPVA